MRSAVIASQARYLREAGYRVTVVARNGGSDTSVLPEGTPFVELTERSLVGRLEEWGEICRTHEVDVVIDHQILYLNTWPEFALMARHSLRAGKHSHGAAQFDWGFPISRTLRGHVQIFDGYGESLIDYDHRATYLGLGISLLEWY